MVIDPWLLFWFVAGGTGVLGVISAALTCRQNRRRAQDPVAAAREELLANVNAAAGTGAGVLGAVAMVGVLGVGPFVWLASTNLGAAVIVSLVVGVGALMVWKGIGVMNERA